MQMMGTINHLQQPPQQTLKKRRLKITAEAGFTIIETLIVLAIAGLILLIVFEAIPAVERASRNSQRKQDVNIILAAVSQYELKDSGNFPQVCSGTRLFGASPLACIAQLRGYPNDNFLRFSQNDLSNYTSANSTNPVQIIEDYPQNSGKNYVLPASTTQTVVVYDFDKCDNNNTGGASSIGADYSDAVALFALEEGNRTLTPQCQDI